MKLSFCLTLQQVYVCLKTALRTAALAGAVYVGAGERRYKACSVLLQVKELVKSAYTRARHILTQHERDLHTLAKELLDKETLSGEQIKKLLKIAIAPSEQTSVASS